MKQRLSTLIILFILVLGGFSCNKEPDDPVFDYNLKSAKVIETNNQFGLALLNSVFEHDDTPNIMISPTSVSLALGMTYNGAEGDTREAFEQVLNYEGLTREEVNEITKELIRVLVTNAKGNLVEIANSIWNDEGFPVRQEFIDLNDEYFDAQVREIDLQTQEALDEINTWVSERTHGKIDRILDQMDPSTVMLLINAIYFNCVWEVEFDPDDNHDYPFYNEDGTRFGMVEMMELESTFRVAENEDFCAVELPYKNKKFSMFLFLPAEGSTIDGLTQGLDGASWNSWLEDFREVPEFTIQMPKFKFEYKRSLSNELKQMGLAVAFTEQADFSGISEVPVLITDVIHKTYIDVNEEGTEAAAVTGVVVGITSVGPGSVIRFDRPFLFAITENSSKSILFAGRVAEPSYDH